MPSIDAGLTLVAGWSGEASITLAYAQTATCTMASAVHWHASRKDAARTAALSINVTAGSVRVAGTLLDAAGSVVARQASCIKTI